MRPKNDQVPAPFHLLPGEGILRSFSPGSLYTGKYLLISLTAVVLLVVVLLFFEEGDKRNGLLLVGFFFVVYGGFKFYTTRNTRFFITNKRLFRTLSGGVYLEIPLAEIREISFHRKPWGNRVVVFVLSDMKLFRRYLNDWSPEDAAWFKKWLRTQKIKPHEIRG